LFGLAELFLDRVIYKGRSGRWFVASTLAEAQEGVIFSKIYEKITILSLKLLKGRLSKNPVLKMAGVYLQILLKFIAHIKESLSSQILYDVNLFKNTDGILCDITVEGKSTNKILRGDLKHFPKFSMLHGLGPAWVLPNFNCIKSVDKKPNVVVYSMSHLEVQGYKKCFGILDKNIVHVGIPRHDNEWIEFICNKSEHIKSEKFDSFVFIIGRPASSYNTPERKKKALTDIYNIVCVKHKMKLVVKSHPKESINGVDGKIYKEGLGLENYGKDWIYSDRHPFVLGKRSIFSISFYSGVVLDMLAIGKPTIEYLDLVGLSSYDNSKSLRDEYGNPVFQYAYTNLALSARSSRDLDGHVESILHQYQKTTLSLHSRYKDYFSTFDESSNKVASDIYNKLNF
jgi:hypothetical protein